MLFRICVARKLNTVDNCLTDTDTLLDTQFDRRAEVNAAIETRDRRFVRSHDKRGERALRESRDQSVIDVGRVGKRFLAEHVGKDGRRRARLYGMAGGVLREGRGTDEGRPDRV